MFFAGPPVALGPLDPKRDAANREALADADRLFDRQRTSILAKQSFIRLC